MLVMLQAFLKNSDNLVFTVTGHGTHTKKEQSPGISALARD